MQTTINCGTIGNYPVDNVILRARRAEDNDLVLIEVLADHTIIMSIWLPRSTARDFKKQLQRAHGRIQGDYTS